MKKQKIACAGKRSEPCTGGRGTVAMRVAVHPWAVVSTRQDASAVSCKRQHLWRSSAPLSLSLSVVAPLAATQPRIGARRPIRATGAERLPTFAEGSVSLANDHDR